jgi:hypothetical protein
MRDEGTVFCESCGLEILESKAEFTFIPHDDKYDVCVECESCYDKNTNPFKQ